MMGENSSIEWCDHTFNPWMGCQKISAGCTNCYALDLMETRYGRVKWGPQGTRIRTSDANWKKPLQWNRQAEKEGRRFRVFCASLADVFEDRPELVDWRNDLLHLISQTRNLDWLLLTKRPENVNRMIVKATGRFEDAWLADCKHVWLGASVENQEQADKRIPELLKIDAKVRFLSMEPLLGPVDLSLWLGDLPEDEDGAPYPGNGLSWAIVGGESGHDARPMHNRWVRSIRDQCIEAKIPFHFKQHGEWIGMADYDPFVHGFDYSKYEQRSLWAGEVNDPNDLPSLHMRVGKKAAGRLLDGVEWNEMPEAVI